MNAVFFEYFFIKVFYVHSLSNLWLSGFLMMPYDFIFLWIIEGFMESFFLKNLGKAAFGRKNGRKNAVCIPTMSIMLTTSQWFSASQ